MTAPAGNSKTNRSLFLEEALPPIEQLIGKSYRIQHDSTTSQKDKEFFKFALDILSNASNLLEDLSKNHLNAISEDREIQPIELEIGNPSIEYDDLPFSPAISSPSEVFKDLTEENIGIEIEKIIDLIDIYISENCVVTSESGSYNIQGLIFFLNDLLSDKVDTSLIKEKRELGIFNSVFKKYQSLKGNAKAISQLKPEIKECLDNAKKQSEKITAYKMLKESLALFDEILQILPTDKISNINVIRAIDRLSQISRPFSIETKDLTLTDGFFAKINIINRNIYYNKPFKDFIAETCALLFDRPRSIEIIKTDTSRDILKNIFTKLFSKVREEEQFIYKELFLIMDESLPMKNANEKLKKLKTDINSLKKRKSNESLTYKKNSFIKLNLPLSHNKTLSSNSQKDLFNEHLKKRRIEK